MKKTEGVTVDLALLIIRLALGAVFIAHGAAKFFPQYFGGGGIEGFAKALGDMQVPAPLLMAYLSAGWELGGGALLVIGLASRIAALGLVANMVVALVKVHLHNGFFMMKPGTLLEQSQQVLAGKVGYEYIVVLGAMALAVVIAGPGQVALDAMFAKGPKKGP